MKIMKVLTVILLAVFVGACGHPEGDLVPLESEQSVSYEATVNDDLVAVFLGDSFMNILDVGRWFPASFNEGVSGETTLEIQQRVPDIIANYEPCQVFILAGVNDIFKDARTAPEVYSTYVEIIDELSAHGFTVTVISTCFVADLSWTMTDEINQVVGELNFLLKWGCAVRGLNYIDLAAIVCPYGVLDPDYDSGDAVHMNDDGYAVLNWLINND